ncbi:MAG: class I SAM-dependent methyltransferase [Nitrospinales bacterium]
MIRSLYKKYWAVGFRSRLYDLLAPRAYLHSIARSIESAGAAPNRLWLDAGCGSGLALIFLRDRLRNGECYLGTDVTASGVERTLARIKTLNVKGHCVRADFTQAMPLRENSVDVILAHFSTYTVADDAARLLALKNFRKALKPAGTLALANPSKNYDARRIIRESLEQVRKANGTWAFLASKWALYPPAFWLGLRFIERQLKTGVWKAYTRDELCDEVRRAGFVVQRVETVYAGSGYLVVGEKSA